MCCKTEFVFDSNKKTSLKLKHSVCCCCIRKWQKTKVDFRIVLVVRKPKDQNSVTLIILLNANSTLP